MKRLALAALVLIGAVTNLYAQSGQLGAWQVFGNPTGSAGQSKPADITALIDGKICGTNGDFIVRVAGVWQCGSAGTGLAFSTGTLNLQAASAGAIGGVNSITSAAHNWVAYIDTAGLPHQSQPAIGDVSGWGTGVATALGNSLNASGGLVGFTGAFANIAPTPTRAGDILYWNGSSWTTLAGNNSGTQVLQETSSGVPSWATITGTGTVSQINTAGGLRGGPITTTGTLLSPGGFLNRFRNGTFDIWQRGTSALPTSTSAPGSYTVDGWEVQQTGAAFTCAQSTGNNGTQYSLQCVGGTSNTDTIISQPIQSNVAYVLAGSTVTVQFQYKQDTGGAITPKISTCFASVQNNFATCTSDLASTSLTSCASGSWCTEAYTLNVSASATNGYRVSFDCNTALTSGQHCYVTAADIRVTPGVTTGVNSNAPPPELRPYDSELNFDQQWYAQFTAPVTNTTFATAVAINSTQVDGVWTLPQQMTCTAPTVTYSSASNYRVVMAGTASTGSAVTTNGSSASVIDIRLTISSATAGQAGLFQIGTSGATISASCEL